jgi:hypothetical protein
MNPDVITFGGDPQPRSTSPTRRRLRRLAEKAVLVAATSAILLAVHTTSGDRSPDAQPAGSASPTPSAQTPNGLPTPPVHLRLVVPETAVPGERLTVLAYRNRRLCGAAELRFDGAPTSHELLRYAGPANQDHAQMFVAMEVPRSAKPGSHEIDLYGPRPGGSGPICGDVSEHQGRLATATISVKSAPG